MTTNFDVSKHILSLKDKINMTADVEYFMSNNEEKISIRKTHIGCEGYAVFLEGVVYDEHLTLEEAHILANDQLNKMEALDDFTY